ncbi:amidase domain-containing protein [Streptomyces sp. NPDC006332]|uniref:amidase domain-containing protein n=1 Tax=Streptomyces sp. NPDC006332 TaxID=3155456 RepID=UPI0033A1B710
MLGTSATAAQNGRTSAATALSAAETEDLTQAAEGYLQLRTDAVTVNHAGVRRFSQIAATQSMIARTDWELVELEEKGERYEKVDGGYTKAEVDVTVNGVERAGDNATLSLTEDGRLYMPFTAEQIAEGAPEYEEYSLPHTLKFTLGPAGSWLLAEDKAEIGSGPTPSTQLSEPEALDDGGGVPEEEEGGKGSTSSATEASGSSAKVTADYNYSKMIDYANKYWKNPNNDDYRTYGNDCTNFVSQIMKAGGWKIVGPTYASLRRQNTKWFYTIYVDRTSFTWAGAENWYWFATKHSKRTKILSNVYHMEPSDVLQADWDRNGNINHTMFVTKKYDGVPYLTYHTTNTHNKSFKKIHADHRNAWWYAHRT